MKKILLILYNIANSPRGRLQDAGRGCADCNDEGGGEEETFFLLQENGDRLQQETSDNILLN